MPEALCANGLSADKAFRFIRPTICFTPDAQGAMRSRASSLLQVESAVSRVGRITAKALSADGLAADKAFRFMHPTV
ncbi:hypothetical protein AADU03_005296 [Escherichia coli]